jgi:hypothetical protein
MEFTKTAKTTKTPKSIFVKSSGMIRCSGCMTAVRADTTPSNCKTCEKVKNEELVQCKCGNDDIFCYRAKTLDARNCIRCIFLGLQNVRTTAQGAALGRYQICEGVCRLVQPFGRKFCHDCEACAHANPILRKKLTAMKIDEQRMMRLNRWSNTVWDEAFLQFRSLERSDKLKMIEKARETQVEQDDEEDFLRILHFAQSGKHRSLNSTVPRTGLKSMVAGDSVIAMKPIVVLKSKPRKTCDVESFEEFPSL